MQAPACNLASPTLVCLGHLKGFAKVPGEAAEIALRMHISCGDACNQ